MSMLQQELLQKKPFLALAPMEDVTDGVFRRLVAGIHPPDIFFTEFQSARSIAARRKQTIDFLQPTPSERPLFAQIWGTEPEYFYQAARFLTEAGFDGIDINMGCPMKKIVRKGACTALIGNTALTRDLVAAVRSGIDESSAPAGNRPRPMLSIKTRSGRAEPETAAWCGFLLSLQPDMLTLHPRTAAQLYRGDPDWSQVKLLCDLRSEMNSSCLIVGNGNVSSLSQARQLASQTGADGIMIGRAAIANPAIFAPDKPPFADLPLSQRAETALQHSREFLAAFGTKRNPAVLKKFYRAYFFNERNSAIIQKLMHSKNADESLHILKELAAVN